MTTKPSQADALFATSDSADSPDCVMTTPNHKVPISIQTVFDIGSTSTLVVDNFFKDESATCEFMRSADGQVNDFKLGAARVENLRFEKR